MEISRSVVRRSVVSIAFIIISACSDQQAPASLRHQLSDHLLIECEQDCGQAGKAIKKMGGRIDVRFANIPALAVSIPTGQQHKLLATAGVKTLAKDLALSLPRPTEQEKLRFQPATIRDDRDLQKLSAQFIRRPNNYLLNSHLSGAATLHGEGITGAGIIVAVIDSGIASNAEVVPMLADSVIGGENFINDPDEPSATSTLNDPHGTMVASMIAAHGGLLLGKDSALAAAVQRHAPDSLLDLEDDSYLLPMIGTAPDARLYALKTFPADGDGAPVSRVLMAMDRIVTLKKNYLLGASTDPVSGDGSEENPFTYDALDIDVVNMSLGGPTLFAGFELDDMLTLEMRKAGITVVSSTGNDGPAAMTSGSPSTGFGSLAVGAASSAAHERILRELQNGPDTGDLFRPTDHMQIAVFSSRGPVADGRNGVDLVANGVASFVQGADGDIFLVSGTSFSAPTVAGAAALLHSALTDIDSTVIDFALLSTANSEVIGGNAGAIDRGSGFVAVDTALAWLREFVSSNQQDSRNEEGDSDRRQRRTDRLRDPLPIATTISRAKQRAIEFEDGIFTQNVELMPGDVQQFFIPGSAMDELIQIDITGIQPELPVEMQNTFFGDDLIVTLVDAPTSFADIIFDDFVFEDSHIEATPPQTGLLRLALTGDWTNAGKISATVTVSTQRAERMRTSVRRRIGDDDLHEYEFVVTSDMTALDFKLSWSTNWGYYPTHDLDLIVIAPDETPYFDAASLRSPEALHLDNPLPGTWKVLVDGFLLHRYEDVYQLRVYDQNRRLLSPSLPRLASTEN